MGAPGFVYDIEVYGTHNYLAHGLWNHNSGKTVQYYGAAADLISSGKVDRALMSMPAGVVAQQGDYIDKRTGKRKQGELNKFLDPEMAKQAAVATSSNFNRLMAGVKSGQIKLVIVTPELARSREKQLLDAGFGGERSMYIADEGHRLATGHSEGMGSEMARTAQKLAKSEYCVAGSGTLIENDASELHSLLDLVNPGENGSEQDFTQEWQRAAQGIGKNLFAQEAIGAIAKRLSGRMISYGSEPVSPTGNPISLERKTQTVPVSPRQKAAIAQVNAEYRKDYTSRDPNVAKAAGLRRAQAVQKILSAGVPYGKGQVDNPKLQAIRAIMSDEKARDPKNRVGIFSDEYAPIDAASKSLRSAFSGNRKIESLSGRETPDQIRRTIDRVNDRSNNTSGVAFTKSGATGVNMQGLDHIVKMHPIDTPSLENQIDHRHYRRGQTRNVRSTTLVSDHPLEQMRQFRTSEVKLPEIQLLAVMADRTGMAGTIANNIDLIKRAV